MGAYDPLPYVPQPYDSSRSDARMADLMRYQGDIQRASIERAGERRARMISGIGNRVSGAIGDLVQYRQDKPKRELEQRRIADEIRQRDQADKLRAVNATLGGKTDEERAAALEAAGFIDEAGAVRDKGMARQQTKASLRATELGNREKAIKQAGDALDSIAGRSTDARAAAYKASLPSLRALVPDFEFPEEFSEDFLKTGRQLGKTETELLAKERERILTIDAAQRQAKSEGELAQFWQGQLGRDLAQVKDVNEWVMRRGEAASLGAPLQVLSKFGTDYSPEAVRRAGQLAKAARTTGATTAGTDVERYVERNAQRVYGKTVEDLSKDEEDKLRRDFDNLTPNKSASTTVTPATRASAVARRDDDLAELDAKVGLSKEDRERKANRIWASYYDQVQETPPPPIFTQRGKIGARPSYEGTAEPPGGGQEAPTTPATAPRQNSKGQTIAIGAQVVVRGEKRVVVGFTADGKAITQKR